jgi:hypothetical protein
LQVIFILFIYFRQFYLHILTDDNVVDTIIVYEEPDIVRNNQLEENIDASLDEGGEE